LGILFATEQEVSQVLFEMMVLQETKYHETQKCSVYNCVNYWGLFFLLCCIALPY